MIVASRSHLTIATPSKRRHGGTPGRTLPRSGPALEAAAMGAARGGRSRAGGRRDDRERRSYVLPPGCAAWISGTRGRRVIMYAVRLFVDPAPDARRRLLASSGCSGCVRSCAGSATGNSSRGRRHRAGAKGFLADCRMCGQCPSAYGNVLPDELPQEPAQRALRRLRPNGNCEVKPEMRCVWVEAWQGGTQERQPHPGPAAVNRR